MFFSLDDAILIMDMYVKKSVLCPIILILAVFGAFVLFTACDAVDTLFTSADTYKINAYVGCLPLSECSFISLNDEITPFFEESVSKDPDITSLIISIQNPTEKESKLIVVYSLENETEQYDDVSSIQARSVKNMDYDLTSFLMPEDLEMGFYTLVFEIMSGNIILQRTEKEFFYLGNTVFSYDDIAIHLPGISDNPQVISRGQVVLLEAKLNFDSILDPYIIWYNGKTKITEGLHSNGAGLLFWKAPEQSNFYTLRAEVYPVYDYEVLTGYKKEISVLVSSKIIDVNLISENIPELLNWYVFEGNLQDSKNPVQIETVNAAWVPFNGTYGLGTGNGNVFLLPKTSIPAGGDSWQLLFRFKPLNNGSILTVNFGTSANVVLDLSIIENTAELTLTSPLKKVSRTYSLPVNQGFFITMGISFSVTPTQVFAKINILEERIEEGELALPPLRLEASVKNEFHIILGQESEYVSIDEFPENALSDILEENEQEEPAEPDEITEIILQDETEGFVKPSISLFTVIWDEFALYNKPPMEVIAKDILSDPAEEVIDSE